MNFNCRIRLIFNNIAASLLIGAAAAPAMAETEVPAPAKAEERVCQDPATREKPQWLTPKFDVSAKEQQRLLAAIDMPIGRTKPDGIFTERTVHSVTEFRMLAKNLDYRESLTAADKADLALFVKTTQQYIKTYKIAPEEAAALRFAVIRTKVSAKDILDADTITDPALWLHLVRQHGDKYGLGTLATNIRVTDSGAYTVDDPLIREQIMDLRHHPRLGMIFKAEWLRTKDKSIQISVGTPAVLPDTAQHLRTFGFDLGEGEHMHEGALAKFDMLYRPAFHFFKQASGQESLSGYIALFAEQARIDAAQYKISPVAAAAIRLASIRTGADFAYMMELSSAESSFDPDAKARTSSATGLYQFTEDTWLHMIRRYGHKYGLAELASEITSEPDMYGTTVARMKNPFRRFAALDLRRDPHLAALFGAEFQLQNKHIIECAVGRPLNRTEQYLGHFLGSAGASKFLDRMAENPSANGVKLFPTAAAANKAIFYKRAAKGRLQPRTLREIYAALDRKFETGSFEDHEMQAAILPRPSATPEF